MKNLAGFLNVKTGIIAISIGIVFLFSSCSSSSGNGLPACETNQVFSLSPIVTNDIQGLVPLGNLNPTGHTMPTRHMYFYLMYDNPDDAAPRESSLRAPGDIRITSISSSEHLSENPPYTDYKIEFASCASVTGYFGHVQSLSSTLQDLAGNISGNCSTYSTGGKSFRNCSKSVTVDVTAGTELGIVGGNSGQIAFDFGLRDSLVSLSFANESRVLSDMKNVVCPLDYFETNPKNELEGMLSNYLGTIQRTEEPLCGTIDVDISGTLQGMWFSDQNSTLNEGEDEHLTLAHNNVIPSVGIFSVGNAIPTLESGVYPFNPQSSGLINRWFSEVTVDGQIYCYEADESSDLISSQNWSNQIILIQLTNATTLQIESQSAQTCGEGPWSFTGSNTIFYR